MAWFDKGKKKAKGTGKQKKINCELCGKSHDLLTGQWVANGKRQILCHAHEGDCFDKVRGKTNDSGKGHPGSASTAGQVGLP